MKMNVLSGKVQPSRYFHCTRRNNHRLNHCGLIRSIRYELFIIFSYRKACDTEFFIFNEITIVVVSLSVLKSTVWRELALLQGFYSNFPVTLPSPLPAV